MRTHPRSLRGRLLALVVGLSAVALVVLAAVLYAGQRTFLYDRLDDRARSSVFLVDRVLTERGIGGGQATTGPPVRSRDGHGDTDGDGRLRPPGGRPGGPAAPQDAYGQRRNAAGKVLGSVQISYGDEALSAPDLPSDVTVGRPFTVDSRDRSLRYRVVAQPTTAGGLTIAAIPMSDTDSQLRRLLITEALLVGGVLGLIGLSGWWVIGYGLRPLDAMRGTAEEIASGGDLGRRVAPAEPGTEVGRLGLALNTMLSQIEQAFRRQQASEDRLRRFLADASHELRTPLASIRGYAELHRMGATRSPEEIGHSIGRIEAESARMGTLVDDLLTLARLDEPREPVREPVALDQLAHDAVSDARAADNSGREITFTAAGDDAVVSGDSDELRKLLGNLLRNALVHTAAGTPIEVMVERDRPPGLVRLTVRDHGPGLPDGAESDLFERFWRASPGRERGPAGAGLGLSIAETVVRQHGGMISATNADGGGAVFVVELPALGEDSGPSEA